MYMYGWKYIFMYLSMISWLLYDKCTISNICNPSYYDIDSISDSTKLKHLKEWMHRCWVRNKFRSGGTKNSKIILKSMPEEISLLSHKKECNSSFRRTRSFWELFLLKSKDSYKLLMTRIKDHDNLLLMHKLTNVGWTNLSECFGKIVD